MKRKTANVNKRRVKAVAMIALIVLLFAFMFHNMKPIIQTVSSNQAKILCTSTVNQAVLSELDNLSIAYDDLIVIKYDSLGNISSIETNSLEMNRLKAYLTDAVNESLAQLPEQNVGIPLGTLTGIELLSGRGPKLRLKMVPSSYVESQLVNKFDSTGINQTRHQIMIEFTVSMNAILAPYTTRVEVTTNIIVAETIIIGNVPDMFADLQG